MDFQLVHQLLYVFGHYVYEGVGLRQLMDLYFAQKVCIKQEPESVKEVLKLFKRMDLMRFVGATQYVLQVVFDGNRNAHELLANSSINDHLDTNTNQKNSLYLICEADKEEGLKLLEDIENGGNHGQYDVRNNVKGETFIGCFWRKWSRKLRMIRFDAL